MGVYRVYRTSVKVLSLPVGLVSFFDLIAGTILLVFGAKMNAAVEEDGFTGETLYIFDIIVSLGALLIFSSFLALCGLCHESFTLFLLISSWLCIPIIFAELAASIGLASSEDYIFETMSRHKAELNLSDEQISTLRSWDTFAIVFLLGLAVVETAKFCIMLKIRKQISDGRKEYRAAIDLQQEEEETGSLQAKLLVDEKYSSLRKMYKDRYSFDGNYNNDFGGLEGEEYQITFEEAGDDGGLGGIGKL
mmetsp:Transcript_3653/g.6921  ORF Transcript_3653/g.6921 Transcript_3653/m.6921 type:complete len:249 (-) Transcript_3653:46-792(-)